MNDPIYLGIDCGATTSKTGAIDARGRLISRELRQSDTRSSEGPGGVVRGWIKGANGFLQDVGRDWRSVAGVGLAIPGPYLEYGVLGPQPNLPSSLEGWRFLDDLTAAVAAEAGRPIPVVTANDGQLAGLAEAKPLQAQTPGSVLMLAPGSGLGCSFVQADGTLLQGDNRAAAILAHMPAPHDKLGLPAFACGCGRNWGCFEAYTAIAGLPRMIRHLLPQFPDHPYNSLAILEKPQALALRGMAREGDPLALAIFDRQAQAMGYAVAAAAMAYDPTHVIIGGGLMDPEATTAEFRQHYLTTLRETAATVFWTDLNRIHFHQAALGELSQAVGAALLALNLITGD